MTRAQWLRLAPLLLMLLLTTLVAMGLFNKDKPNISYIYGMLLPDIDLPAIGQSDQSKRFQPKNWRGHPVVLNVFSSWCEPCAIEHPVLMELAKTGKIAIVGIAWKDSTENVVAYINKYGNPYQLVGLDKEGKTTVPLGLTGVPETFIVDEQGRVAYSTKSPLTEDVLKNEMLPLIEKILANAN